MQEINSGKEVEEEEDREKRGREEKEIPLFAESSTWASKKSDSKNGFEKLIISCKTSSDASSNKAAEKSFRNIADRISSR